MNIVKKPKLGTWIAKRKANKWILIGAVTLIIVALIAVSSMQSFNVAAYTIAPQTVEYRFNEEAMVRSAIRISVAADVSGIIKSLEATEGTAVKKGDVLLKLDTTDTQTAYDQKKIERENIQAQWQQFKDDTERQIASLQAQLDGGYVGSKVKTQLRKQISILNENLDENAASGATLYYKTLLEKADIELKDLETQLKAGDVKAPIDGILANLNADVGIRITRGENLAEIVGEGNLEVECMVNTQDISMLKQDTPVELIWEKRDGDVYYPASIKSISTVATGKVNALGLSEQRVRVVISPDFSSSDITPSEGVGLRAEFIAQHIENCLAVPKTAIFKHEDGDAVWKIVNGKLQAQLIKKGLSNDRMTIITDGLANGDKVVENASLDGLSQGLNVAAK